MPNKNDKADLVQFFGAMAAIIFCLVWLLSFGYARAEKRFGGELRKMDAQITDYVCRKWQEGGE